jgi:DNA gyrase subunit A
MEDSFGINNVALVDGQPRTLGLKDLLHVFLDHRFDVVRRRSAYRRTKAADRLHLVEGLLVAILDIDEVIQLIRASDNAAAAKERLISVFDLSETQADYILDMPLRRLTKFSKLELDKEKAELERTIEALDAILADDRLLRKVVSDELGEVAKTFGTPRRTVLLESAGVTVSASAAPLEIADDPCFAYLSSSGLLARSSSDEPPSGDGARANHDVIVSAVHTTARGEIGALTSHGRLVRLNVLDLPALPGSASHPNLQGGLPFDLVRSLQPGERVLALSGLRTEGPGLALGTRQGVVKRVNPEVLGKDEWDVIGLKDGDEVVGAVELRSGDEELCFISSDAQLLHFGAGGVRPQGRSGGGMAGIKLGAGQSAVWFGALDPASSVVVTASGSSTALPGTEPGAVKVTPFVEYPGKGRATGGVRCHRFLKGEDALVFAWAGSAPARAAAASGSPVDLPEANGRRDGSGVPGSQPIVACAGPVLSQL